MIDVTKIITVKGHRGILKSIDIRGIGYAIQWCDLELEDPNDSRITIRMEDIPLHEIQQDLMS